MKRLVFRLLMIMLAIYGLGIMTQLYATEPGKRELPPSEFGKTMADIISAPSRLSSGGCSGCGASLGPVAQVPTGEEAGEEPGMTEAQKNQEIAKIQTDANTRIKGLRDRIKNYNQMKQEGTSTLTNEQLDSYINHAQKQISQIETETNQKIADVKAGKVKPPAAPETVIAATGKETPVEEKPAPEKPTAVEPKKVEKPAEKTEQEKQRDKEWDAEKRDPLPPPDREHDPELNAAVDAIADNTGIGAANMVIEGKVPISPIDFTGKDFAELLKDTATSGPLAAAGKKAAEKGVEYASKVMGSFVGRAAIERLYRENYENGNPSSKDDQRLAREYARSQGCPNGKEDLWIAAYLVNRKQDKDRLTAGMNSSYRAYKESLQKDWSAFGLPAKARYQQERQRLLNSARMY
ncbi:MAG: hypothetical protein PHW74_11375 [Desulfobacca sp.]|nr:hypothetical protein [Desulfobacca sp.]